MYELIKMMRNKNQIVCSHKTRKGMGRFASVLPESTENLENLRNILNEDSRPNSRTDFRQTSAQQEKECRVIAHSTVGESPRSMKLPLSLLPSMFFVLPNLVYCHSLPLHRLRTKLEINACGCFLLPSA